MALGATWLVLARSCAPAAGAVPVGGPVGESWELTFREDFDQTSAGALLASGRWASGWFGDGDITGPVDRSRDTALMRRSNITVSDGVASFEISPNSEGLTGPDPVGWRPNLGAVITSDVHQGARPGLTVGYGYVEARMQLPAGAAEEGVWPAWWLNGPTWPSDMEIDVLEGNGTDTGCFNIHHGTDGSDTVDLGGQRRCATVAGATTGMHTYGADIRPDGVTFYYDGEEVGAYAGPVPAVERYLVLGISSFGTVTGPRHLLVDHVRAWSHR